MSKEIEEHRNLNHSGNEPFSSVLDKHISRRSIMRGGLGMAALTVFGGFGLAGCSDNDDDDDDAPVKTALTLAFEAIAGSKTDAFAVAAGYTAQVLIPWGTPLNNSAPAWREDLGFTPEIQLNTVGMHHDGMAPFPLDEANAANHFILALNNEYIDQGALWAPQGGPTNKNEGARPADEVRTEINAHGVTLVEVRKTASGQWEHVLNSQYNRRYTSATEFALSGPVAGTDYVKTKYSPEGRVTRGTNNNCANGYTPWGTYLTCEENWPGYFVKDSGREIDDDRLGVGSGRGRYGWETAAGDASEQNDEFARFNATPIGANATEDYRNEPRTFGYIVEIDPYTGERVKRTHLGRFRHEGCWPGKLVAGEPVVFYTGHDSRNEYIYKFVSDAVWDPADQLAAGSAADRLAIGAKYMDKGTLYVAKFNADGTGQWLPLTPEATTRDGRRLSTALGLANNDLAGVIIHTCDAADLMGATPMDRPEWGTVDPVSGEVYMTLTNNSKRTEAGSAPTYTNSGSNIEALGVGYATAPVNGPNPRADNEGGQVIRWLEPSVGATTFEWDIFVCGAAASDANNLSGLTELNQFASPDGLYFDARDEGQGILWIETDNGYDAVTDYTNDQVLAVVPANVKKADGDITVVGAADQAQLKRFAVGPNGCEVTGIFTNADKTALFVNIQHPANWPSTTDATVVTSGNVRPRASTVVIQKVDGGQVGV